MISLSSFVKVIDELPIFVIKIGGGTKRKYEKLFFKIYLICSAMFLYNTSVVIDIFTFVDTGASVFGTLARFCSIIYVSNSKGENCVTLQDFNRLNEILPGFQPENEYTAVFSAIIYICVVLESICTLFSTIGFSLGSCYTLGSTILSYGLIYQLTMLKCLVVGRLDCVRNKTRSGEPLQKLSYLHALLELNERMDMFYSLIVSATMMKNFIDISKFMAYMWCDLGLNTHMDRHNLDIKVFFHMMIEELGFLWVVHTCTSVTSRLEDIKSELDRMISCLCPPQIQRQQMLVFMQELELTPQTFDCLGLFDFECSSVTKMCILIVNVFMVYIQFVKACT